MLKKWWISVHIAACIMFSSYFCTFYMDIHSLKYFQSIYRSCCKVRTRFVTCKLGDCRVWTLSNPINSKPKHNSGGVGIRTDSEREPVYRTRDRFASRDATENFHIHWSFSVDSALHYSLQKNPLALRVIVALEEKIKGAQKSCSSAVKRVGYTRGRTLQIPNMDSKWYHACAYFGVGYRFFFQLMNKSEGSDSAANSDTQKFERPLHWFLFALLAGVGANIHYVPARLRILLALASLWSCLATDASIVSYSCLTHQRRIALIAQSPPNLVHNCQLARMDFLLLTFEEFPSSGKRVSRAESGQRADCEWYSTCRNLL